MDYTDRPKCYLDKTCFAQDEHHNCKILTDTWMNRCCFYKTPEEYAEGLKKYGDGRDYARPHIAVSQFTKVAKAKKKGN